MNTEIRVPNADGALIAGMYAEVALTLPSPHAVFELPSTALMNDASGLRVASVDDDSKIHLVPVVVERDEGREHRDLDRPHGQRARREARERRVHRGQARRSRPLTDRRNGEPPGRQKNARGAHPSTMRAQATRRSRVAATRSSSSASVAAPRSLCARASRARSFRVRVPSRRPRTQRTKASGKRTS